MAIMYKNRLKGKIRYLENAKDTITSLMDPTESVPVDRGEGTGPNYSLEEMLTELCESVAKEGEKRGPPNIMEALYLKNKCLRDK